MIRLTKMKLACSIQLFILVLISMVFMPGLLFAEVTNEERSVIADEVRKELLRLINEENILDLAIERGIEKFVANQRQQARSNSRGRNAANIRPVDKSRDHIKGNPDAEITLVEYSDYECPFCKVFHETAHELVKQSEGRVNWVYRHFPLEFHNPGAQKQAEAAECAAKQGGSDAFWQYSDLIFERTRSNGRGFPIADLTPLAEEIGLSKKAFQECLENDKMRNRVLEDYQNGVESGITGTPGNILLNNRTKRVIPASGALPLGKLMELVEQLRNPPPTEEVKIQ